MQNQKNQPSYMKKTHDDVYWTNKLQKNTERYNQDSRLDVSKWTDTDDQANSAIGKEMTEVLMDERWEQNLVLETSNFMPHTNHPLRLEILKNIEE